MNGHAMNAAVLNGGGFFTTIRIRVDVIVAAVISGMPRVARRLVGDVVGEGRVERGGRVLARFPSVVDIVGEVVSVARVARRSVTTVVGEAQVASRFRLKVRALMTAVGEAAPDLTVRVLKRLSGTFDAAADILLKSRVLRRSIAPAIAGAILEGAGGHILPRTLVRAPLTAWGQALTEGDPLIRRRAPVTTAFVAETDLAARVRRRVIAEWIGTVEFDVDTGHTKQAPFDEPAPAHRHFIVPARQALFSAGSR